MLLALIGRVSAEDAPDPWAPDMVKVLMDRVDADPKTDALFQRCPADVFRQEVSFIQRLFPTDSATEALCDANPSVCLGACMDAAGGSACFYTARAFQSRPSLLPQRYSEILFSRACALGDTAGCTNRAASIRNAPFKGDPFEAATDRVKQSCEFRTFTLSCSPESTWGCAMLGQSYELGEGVGRSAVKAEQFYRKACRLSPDFPSCSFAQRGLERVNRRR